MHVQKLNSRITSLFDFYAENKEATKYVKKCNWENDITSWSMMTKFTASYNVRYFVAEPEAAMITCIHGFPKNLCAVDFKNIKCTCV